MMNPQTAFSREHQFVNANEEHEVAYWTKAFGVTRSELQAAVIAVGIRVEDVRARLCKDSQPLDLGHFFIKGSYN